MVYYIHISLNTTPNMDFYRVRSVPKLHCCVGSKQNRLDRAYIGISGLYRDIDVIQGYRAYIGISGLCRDIRIV